MKIVRIKYFVQCVPLTSTSHHVVQCDGISSKIREMKVIDYNTKSNERMKPFPDQVDFNRNQGSSSARDRPSRVDVAPNSLEHSASLHYFYLALPQSYPKPCSKSAAILRDQHMLWLSADLILLWGPSKLLCGR